MNPSDINDPDVHLWWILSEVQHVLYRARQKELDRYEISSVQAGVLHAILEIGYHSTPAEVSRWMMREPHTVSAILARMEAKELIGKHRDLGRRDLIRLEVTEKGNRVYAVAMMPGIIRVVLDNLNEEEYRQFRDALLQLRQAALSRLSIKRIPPYPHVPYSDVWWLLSQTRRLLLRVRELDLRKSDISAVQSDVLFAIKTIGENATPADISRKLIREHHSTSGILARMEEKGLIRRVKDLERRNMIRVTITDEGEKAFALSLRKGDINSVLGSLTEKERLQLSQSLEKLRSSIVEYLKAWHNQPFPIYL